MKYRVISTSDVPMSLPFTSGAVLLKKRGDSAEVDISETAAARIAEPGAVRFERVEEPEAETPAKPAEPKASARTKPAAADPTATPPADPATKSE